MQRAKVVTMTSAAALPLPCHCNRRICQPAFYQVCHPPCTQRTAASRPCTARGRGAKGGAAARTMGAQQPPPPLVRVLRRMGP